MTSPAPPNEVGNSTQKGVPEPSDEHHASSDESSIEDQSTDSTAVDQPQDVKSLEGRESRSVKDRTIASGTHEPQDDGNTNMFAVATGPGRRAYLPWSRPPASGQTQINERFLQAAHKGDWEAMSTEIQSEADLNAKTSFFKETALHLACRLGHHTVLQNLLKQDSIKSNLKEYMEARDIDRWTPLHSACSQNKTGFKRLYGMMSENLDVDILRMLQSPSHTKAEITRQTLDILFDSQAATRFNIDAGDGEEQTALHMACIYSSVEVVNSLVSNGASVNVKDSFGNTPLMEACRHQSEDVIKFLLGNGAEVNVANEHGSSPLTLACQYQEDKKAAVVKSLLGAEANCDWADNNGDSPLIVASKLGKTAIVREILEHKPKDLDTKNKNGENALKCAMSNKKFRDELVPLLLNGGCKLDQQNASILFPRRTIENFSGDDPQQSAWSKMIQHVFLERNQLTGTDLSATIESLLGFASKEEKVFAVIKANTEHFEVLYNATKEPGLHKDICKLIRNVESGTEFDRSDCEIRGEILNTLLHEHMNDMPTSLRFEDVPDTLLQFSAFHGDYMLVWYILKTSQFGGRDDVERAKIIAKSRTELRNSHGAEYYNRYVLTISVLQMEAAITNMSKQLPKKTPTRPTTEDMRDKEPNLQRYHTAVIDFYERGQGKDGPIDLLRASPSVFDLVYAGDDSGVDGIMETAKTTFNEMLLATKNDEMSNDGKPRLRWIHLPANHHLTERVYSGKKQGEKWFSFYDLAQRSRIELPSDESKVKFMKPICIKEEQQQKPEKAEDGSVKLIQPEEQQQKPEKAKDGSVKLIQPEDKNSHGHDSQGVAPRMALYQENLHAKHRELKEMNQGSILHGPRSLDRFYYNALSQEKMDERDRSQVVTRGLLKANSSPGGIVPKTITKWPYLTVDQLWIWVIDEDTIITSSTHREDGFDNLLVDRIFDQLQQGSSKRSGQETPTSAIEMAQFLVSSCVDFIGKLTWEDVCHDDDSEIRKDAKSKPVLLLFAEKLNEAMASEKDLFQKFRKRVKVEKKRSKRKEPTHQMPQQDEASRDTTNDVTDDSELRPEEAHENNTNDWDAVYSAAELLDEVKDIRDELVILRFLVTQQEHVWTELMGTHPDSYDARSPRFTGEELDDMIKKTETIQTSVKELLNLEENSIGIKESEQLVTLAKRADQQSAENARQERILMLFTFVTIVFTPLSFMASYYALNTSTSRHNDGGELEYEPRWIKLRIFGTSAGVVGSLLFYAYFGAILAIPARIRWLVKNKSKIWKLMKTERLIYAIIAASKVREYFRSESGEDFVVKIEQGQYEFTGREDVAAHRKVQVCCSQD